MSIDHKLVETHVRCNCGMNYKSVLDSEGKILDSKLAWSVAYSVAWPGEKKKWSVKSSLDLPLNATAVTFSYMGSATQAGGRSDYGTINWSFFNS